jgi:Fe-S-cluster containining protein
MSKKTSPSHADSTVKPWYSGGLKFECSQCGDCCTGESGYVWVNKEEIAQLAEQLGLEVDEFERRHVRKIGIRKSLDERANGDCVLFDAKTRACTVYNQRPRQCRTWPFWDSNVRTKEAWRETCEVCPGSGKGPLVSLEVINERLKVIRV